MKSKYGLFASFIIGLALVPAAYAIRGDVVEGRSLLREASSSSDAITIKGTLNCEMAAVNDGGACALSIIEEGTGKKYGIQSGAASATAMNLYHSGHRSVTIQGRTAGVNEISATNIASR